MSDSEDQLEASSFSSLPTSQFVLRPFSSDVDMDSMEEPSNDTAVAGAVPSDYQAEREGRKPTPPITTTTSGIGNGDNPIVHKNQSAAPDQDETRTAPPPPLPPTQLTSIQGSLPVQIHVENIKFLPKRDPLLTQNGTSPAFTKGQQRLTLPQGQVAASVGGSATPTLTDSRQTSSVTGGCNSLGGVGGETTSMSWFMEHPSSSIQALNHLSDMAQRCSRFHRRVTVKLDTTAVISTQLHSGDISGGSERKKDDFEPVSTSSAQFPPIPTIPRLTSSLVDTPPPHPPLQQPTSAVFPVGGLATDQVQGVREKRPFPPPPPPPANYQKGSPNGNLTDVLQDGRKLPIEQELKQALSSG